MIDSTLTTLESFPSTDDPYQSIQTVVATEVEKDWVALDVDFRLADGRSIATASFGLSGDPAKLGEELEGSLADLEFFKAQVDAFYAEAKDVLLEARELAG